MSINCQECNESLRKECYLTHMTKQHPTYLWNEVFCINPLNEDGEYMGLKIKSPLMDVIGILEGSNKAYYIGSESDGADLYLDFGNKMVYNKEHTAIKHILEHQDKHIDNLFNAFKDTMTKEVFLKISKAMTAKIQGSTDKARIRGMRKELEDFKYENSVKLDRLEKIEKEYNELKAVDMHERNKELQRQLMSATAKSYELQAKINSNLCELEDLRADAAARYAYNKENGERIEQDLKLCDQIRKECDVKLIKERNGLDTRLKKAKEDFERDLKKETEKYEKEQEKWDKKERKFKREIKAYKHQLELKKLKESESDSSDSE